MRRLAIAAIVLGCGASGAALAAPGPAVVPNAQALAAAAFATRLTPADLDPIGRILDSQIPAHDFGRGEAGLVGRWPSAISFGAAGLDFDLSPHVRVDADGYGNRSAEAGATLDLSRHLSDLAGERLRALGVADGKTFGDRGRFYLFAAASGRAVGLNMLQGEQGWNRAGWSTDPASRLVGDTQVGLGWRKGAVQTSFGYVHRKVKGDHVMYGVDPHADSMVAFTFAFKPRR